MLSITVQNHHLQMQCNVLTSFRAFCETKANSSPVVPVKMALLRFKLLEIKFWYAFIIMINVTLHTAFSRPLNL